MANENTERLFMFMLKDDLKELTTCEIPMALADLLGEYESTNDPQLIGIIVEYLLLWSKYQQAAELRDHPI